MITFLSPFTCKLRCVANRQVRLFKKSLFDTYRYVASILNCGRAEWGSHSANGVKKV